MVINPVERIQKWLSSEIGLEFGLLLVISINIQNQCKQVSLVDDV